MSAKEVAAQINKLTGHKNNERILFLCPNDASYVITQWAIWISGQIAVPVHFSHPESVLQYYCDDSEANLLVTTLEYADVMQAVANKANKKLLILDDKLRQNAARTIPKKTADLEGGLPGEFYAKNNAMILYTSGTTGSPKGVVLSHKNLQSQMLTLIDAWKWNNNDIILHSLPLHHTHGIVNALMCPLYIGAKCTMLPKFESNAVWSHLLAINTSTTDRITVYMGVPTMYAKLVLEYERIFMKNPRVVEYIKTTLKNKVRLMVSGSAPLPMPLFQKWEEITGHRLLERYGMTEIGMCLSNEYDGVREPGYVGNPLPGVSIRLAAKNPGGSTNIILECSNRDNQIQVEHSATSNRKDMSGELWVKGPSVFEEYFKKPEATQKEFTQDGWFKTGDTAKYNSNKKVFKIMGRTSVDIIKTGGYKVSALEVETYLLGHQDIEDCAIVGVHDDTWGQRVAAVIVLKKNAKMDLQKLRDWSKTIMAEYAVPSVAKFVETIPKNTLGKVNKPELVKKLFADTEKKTQPN
ncbi:Acyl-CoA synthetase family member 3 [Carabus blaptoides fortunei]